MVPDYYIIFAFSLLGWLISVKNKYKKTTERLGTTLVLTDRRKWRKTLLHFLTRTEWMHARKCKTYMDPKNTVKFLFLIHG